MENSIYEVSRDEYAGFVAQINPKARILKEEENDGVKWLKIYSQSTNRLLCAREIYYDTGEEHYYVIEMPPDEERIPARPVRRIVLETREDVQEFFNALSTVMKQEAEKNG